MKINEAAIKLSIPRYYIDYWKKVGLVSRPSSNELDFSDLVKIRFISQCKKNHISLQKIRSVLKNLNFKDEKWHEILSISPGMLLVRNQSLLIEPFSEQIHFEYSLSESERNVLNLWGNKEENPEIGKFEEMYLQGLESGDIKSLKIILKSLLKIKSDHTGALIELGNIAFEENDLETALKFYELVVEHDSECVEAIYNMANIYFRQKKYAAAIRSFHRCIELDPDFPESYYNLGLVYYSLKYFDRALSFLKMYLEIDSDSTWADQARIFIGDIVEQTEGGVETELFHI